MQANLIVPYAACGSLAGDPKRSLAVADFFEAHGSKLAPQRMRINLIIVPRPRYKCRCRTLESVFVEELLLGTGSGLQ